VENTTGKRGSVREARMGSGGRAWRNSVSEGKAERRNMMVVVVQVSCETDGPKKLRGGVPAV